MFKNLAIIFDLDGTLLDTVKDIGEATNRVLAKRGLPQHDIDKYKYFVGDGANKLIKRVLPKANQSNELIQDCLQAFMDDYRNNYNINTKPYLGITELLDTLIGLSNPTIVV